MFRQLSVAVSSCHQGDRTKTKRKKTSNNVAILVGDRDSRFLIYVTKTPRNTCGSKLCKLTKHKKYMLKTITSTRNLQTCQMYRNLLLSYSYVSHTANSTIKIILTS
jgi:hypothetical protein